ncbi:MAG: succinate dehydrogenase, cytochrome b556 subunit [bacterium]
MAKMTSPRPLSPHLQIWGWTVSMAASIIHRATGIAMAVGTLLIAAWLASAALGPQAYQLIQGIFASIFGKIILFAYSWAISFHMLNGLRYLFWDAGYGFEKKTASNTAWASFIGSMVLTALIWAGATYLQGAA